MNAKHTELGGGSRSWKLSCHMKSGDTINENVTDNKHYFYR